MIYNSLSSRKTESENIPFVSSACSPVQSPVKSDLFHVLENINCSIRLYMEAMNGVSKRSYAMGIAVECITLSLKLQAMKQRWEVYLPFHECRDVKFDVWAKLFERKLFSIKKSGRGAEEGNRFYYPENKFWLDVTDRLKNDRNFFEPRYAFSQVGQDVKEYIARVDEQLNELGVMTAEEMVHWMEQIDRWAIRTLKQQYKDLLRLLSKLDGQMELKDTDMIRSYLDTVIDNIGIDLCMVCAVKTLKEQLQELHDFFREDKSEEQYVRLSFRLCERFCKVNEVEDECKKWKMEWPKRAYLSKAKEKREMLLKQLTAWDDDLEPCKLSEYCDLTVLDPLEDPGFGQFLFISRHRLETDKVAWLFKICLEIRWLNEVIQQVTTTSVDKKEDKMSISVADRQLCDRLLELCDRGIWQNGMTAERMKQGISRMLGISGAALDTEHRKLSSALWKLYRNRPKCGDLEKSLRVTWLNFIGWCHRQQLISGTSPALCAVFFPNAPEDAYKAIDKGRNKDIKSFELLTPLFEECLLRDATS